MIKLTDAERTTQERLKASKPRVYDKVIHYPDLLASGKSAALLDVQYSFLCNFHCTHCSISQMRERTGDALTPVDIKDLCDQADKYGLGHFYLDGGEPLAFPDLAEVLEAIGPERFYILLVTNGWLLTAKKAEWLKSAGVDKVQISLDGLDPAEHDEFRNKPGSHAKVLRAIEAAKAAGLGVQIATIVTSLRVQSPEFDKFLDFTDGLGVTVAAQFPKLVGEWRGRYDLLLSPFDMARLDDLCRVHALNTHLSPGYGMAGGCLAGRRYLTINAWGDAMPCSGMRFVLGNIRTDPLTSILDKSMQYYGNFSRSCRLQSGEYNRRFVCDEPAPIEDVMP
jgi:MoaA/NifB/PqqE/SkfB family radical SAM enzyme